MADLALGNALGSLAADVACGAHAAQLWWSRQAPVPGFEEIAKERLDRLVAFARDASPFYRQHYRGLPAGALPLTRLPSVTRAELMAHFDGWVTEREVKRTGVERFLRDRTHVGERYRGRYLVWKSSGSTGTTGIFVQDAEAIAVYDALVALEWLEHAPRLESGRAALVVATGDHYASITSWERMRRAHPAWSAQSFSVQAPVAETVRALNDCRPGLLASYPSMLAILADECDAGRLRISPARLWSGGERLTPARRKRIERAFAAPLTDEYGASEFLSIAHACDLGELHLNAEWVILEPVEADGSPTPRGRLSHTTLLTNLANRVQPLIRYDLGDRIVMRARPCACGNRLPAFRVEGRRDEIVSMRSASGAQVRLAPLALATVVEQASHGHVFQIAQRSASTLSVRLEAPDAHARDAAWQRVSPALGAYLAAQGLEGVRVTLDPQAPRHDAGSGKLRQVVTEIA